MPRGGVPVAYEIALALRLPMTVFLVRKLGVPRHGELAMGAIAEQGVCILNNPLIEQLGITEEQIQFIKNQEQQELERRIQCYRQGQSLASLYGKTIILVDDGIATGSTLKAAILTLNRLKPEKIVLAVPLASKESLEKLAPLVTEIVCLMTPAPFYSVGQWYESFLQTSDEEVIFLLKNRKISQLK